MASDTAPAAVPGPADPPPSTAPTTPASSGTGQQPGGMAGLLAPLEATRAAFTLDPATPTETTAGEQAVTGASSATLTTDDTATENPEKNTKTTSAKQQQSVIRAWMLAGAERWKKGGEARNKRLDVQKERAKARQVKENVTVNRSEKTVNSPGNSSTGSSNNSAGKSLGGKSNGGGKGPGAAPKNTPGPAGAERSGGRGGSSGPTGGTNRGSGGGTGTGSGSKNTSGPSGRGGGSGAKHDKANSSGHTGGKDRPGPGKRTAGESGADSGTSPKTSTSKHTSGTTCGDTGAAKKPGPAGPTGKHGKDSGSTKSPSAKPGKGPASHDKTPTPRTDKGEKSSTDKAQAKPDPKTDPAKPNSAPQRPDIKTVDSSKKTDPDKPDTVKDTTRKPDPAKPGDTSKDTTPRLTGTPKPRINLQTSREAGYRDGTRAAKAAAHTRAWRDGVRDGYRDTTEAADREKTRLDQAHTARKNTRTEAPTVTQPAAQSIPPKPGHAPGPQPVPVSSVDSTHVHLGDSAARASISRGEVRTLRNFQQRLTDKTERMTAVAEATRTLEQHAREQAKQITQLLEQARAVQGGEKVVAALTKLAEAAQVQETKAADIHQRAARSADACQALHTNTETRYGGIYQAVVDSPETSPAELAYYQNMETAGV